MSDQSHINELYQEQLKDHDKQPRNFRVMEAPTNLAVGNNTTCGDAFTVFVKLDNEVISDVSFQGHGCRISKSSASMMTQAVKGKTLAEAKALFDTFHELVTSQEDLEEEELEALGKLAAFSGVRKFPARVKCASLAWHTLHAALENQEQPVTTE